jgi:glycogen synthase
MTILLATFVAVFGRAIQQLNVVHGHYWSAALTPYLIAAGDVAVVLLVVDAGWWSIPWAGTGGAIGATAAMWMHRRFWRRVTV